MSFPTVYYITQVIPSCYSAGYAMCVCVSFGGTVSIGGWVRACVCVCGLSYAILVHTIVGLYIFFLYIIVVININRTQVNNYSK